MVFWLTCIGGYEKKMEENKGKYAKFMYSQILKLYLQHKFLAAEH